MKFIVLDTETANYEYTSICQLGIVVLDDFKISETYDFLIKPYPNVFVKEFSDMHGITSDMVKDAPTFDVVWENIKHLFGKFIPCVAHNAPFDFGHIKTTLMHYGYDENCMDFPILCTMRYAQHSNFEFDKYTLKYLCNYFCIENKNEHSAMSDAIATAKLFIKLIDVTDDDLAHLIAHSYQYSFTDVAVTEKTNKPKHFEGIRQKDITPTNAEYDENHILFGKTVVITGELSTMSRADAYLLIKNVGGLCGDNITKKTNYLVANSANKTGKMKKALQYKEQGQDIEIITEKQLYELLNNK